MLWKSCLPEDMVTLIEMLRLETQEALDREAQLEDANDGVDEDDWDEDQGEGPEVIYVAGDDSDDEDPDEQ